MTTWWDVVNFIFQVFTYTTAAVKFSKKVNELTRKKYSIVEIKEDLKSGELHFGDGITVLGTFSEYLPFIDIKKLLYKDYENFQNSIHTTRLEPINDYYCGSMFTLHSNNSFSDTSMPLFYDMKSKMLEYKTGDMLEMSCKVVQIPKDYQSLMNKNLYSSFERDDGRIIPFGLEAFDVKPHDETDSFIINPWAIGSLDPYPTIRKGKEVCLTCLHSFNFMPIYPLDWPLKSGCVQRDTYDSKISNDTLENTDKFKTFNSKGIPYIIFPKHFDNFEIFYPKVDLYNREQVKLSRDLILGAINENIKTLFAFSLYSNALVIPDKYEVKLDFQYDQVEKMHDQTFNSNAVPKWTCPNYIKEETSSTKENQYP